MKKASPAIHGQPKRRAPRAIPTNLTDKEAVLNLLLQLANQFNLICSLPDVEGNVYLTAETGESLTMLFYDQIKGEA